MSTEAVTDEDEDVEVGAARPARRLPRALLVSGLTLVLMLVAWWAIARAQIWDPVFVPSPGAVLDKLVLAGTEHDGVRGYSGYLLQEHLWATVRRILVASVIAIAVSVPIGIAISINPTLRQMLGPSITFLRQLPPLAYFSLLIIWFGIDETPKVLLLVIAAAPPIIVATAAGVDSVHQDYINGARSLGADRRNLIRFVLIPGALPDVITGIRIGVGVAYTSVVAAETVNGIPGIGGLIRDAQRYNQTDLVIGGILVLGITGLLLDAAIAAAGRRASRWKGRA